MSEKTHIAWCDSTFNPWLGCTKVSAGCVNCYAEHSTPVRTSRTVWGKGNPRKRTSAANWKEPLRWNKAAGVPVAVNWNCCDDSGEPSKAFNRPKVFCGSLCDWLDDEANPLWRLGLMHLIWQTPNLDWLLLSKRIGDWRELVNQCWEISNSALIGRTDFSAKLPEYAEDHFRKWMQAWLEAGDAPNNIWIGTSVENQAAADTRIPDLLRIPARVRFLSVEPLLENVRLDFSIRLKDESLTRSPIHWVIVGGESGPKARPCNVEWIRSVVAQCQAASVPCFVKQLGSNPVWSNPRCPAWSIQHPKGGDPSEWPEDLRVQQFPK